MPDWTIHDIPPQEGKLVVITGANSGLGYETACALAAKGAHVVLAVRNLASGEAAAAAIRNAYPQAHLEVMALDLADLSSVQRFADAFLARYAALPLLVNNAGVMALPYRQTVDGFEMQLGVNHLGHFALTGRLLPAVLAAPAGRIVTVSSEMHWVGKIAFDNLDGRLGYERWRAYGQSKLANLLFAYELQRRLAAAGATAISVACHPGWSATNLQAAGPRMSGSQVGEALFGVINRVIAQSAAMGALPTLYAAISPEVQGCDYIGPRNLRGLRGYPVKQRSSGRSYNAALAAQLWDVSVTLTGVPYEGLAVGA